MIMAIGLHVVVSIVSSVSAWGTAGKVIKEPLRTLPRSPPTWELCVRAHVGLSHALLTSPGSGMCGEGL